MKKVTFSPGANIAAVAKAIHTIMQPAGWGQPQALAAAKKGEVDHVDEDTAKKLEKALTDAGADNISISDE